MPSFYEREGSRTRMVVCVFAPSCTIDSTTWYNREVTS